MLRGIFLRLWVVAALVWYAYNAYVRWDQINRSEPHNWEAAVDYGLNKHLYCNFLGQFDCVKSEWVFKNGPKFDAQLEETLQLILVFAVYPLGVLFTGLAVLTILGWILLGSWRT